MAHRLLRGRNLSPGNRRRQASARIALAAAAGPDSADGPSIESGAAAAARLTAAGGEPAGSALGTRARVRNAVANAVALGRRVRRRLGDHRVDNLLDALRRKSVPDAEVRVDVAPAAAMPSAASERSLRTKTSTERSPWAIV